MSGSGDSLTGGGLAGRWSVWLLGLAAVAVAACSDESAGGGDADAGITPDECPGGRLLEGYCVDTPPRSTPLEACPSGELGEAGICVPLPPALTDWACPDGWAPAPALDAAVEGVAAWTICEPPEPALDCPSGFMPLPGRSDCVRQGLECPGAGAVWHDEETLRSRAGGHGGDLVYVRAGAQGGNGSREQPFGTLADGLFAAREGDIVALSEGTFAETAAIDRPVAVVGACVEGTRIEAPARSANPVIELYGRAGGVVSDLTISGGGLAPALGVRQNSAPELLTAIAFEDGAPFGLAVIRTDAATRLCDIVVRGEHARGLGLIVQDGAVEVERALFADNGDAAVQTVASGAATDVTVTDVVIAGTRAETGPFGFGLDLARASHTVVERAILLDNQGAGVYVWCAANLICSASDRAEVRLTDVRIADTQPSPTGSGGSGLWVEAGGYAEVERGALENNQDLGVAALLAEVHLTDVWVADTRSRPDGEFGRGLEANQGAVVTVERGAFLRNHSVGVAAYSAGSAVDLTDVVIADTQPKPDGSAGFGFGVNTGAHASAERAVIARNHQGGVYALYLDSTITLRDVRVADTGIGRSDLLGGFGLAAGQRTRATVERGYFLRNITLGVGAVGFASTLELTDVLITDTQPLPPLDDFGMGLDLDQGAHGVIERVAVLRSSDLGVHLDGDGTQLDARDLLVVDTDRRPSDHRYGRAFDLGTGASATVERAAMIGSYDAGISVLDGSSATLRDVFVANTHADPDAGELAGASGVIVSRGQLALSNFVVRGSELAGVMVAQDGELTAEDGLISENVVGVNIQVPDFDATRAFVRVRNVDNELNVDYSSLPVPDSRDLDISFSGED